MQLKVIMIQFILKQLVIHCLSSYKKSILKYISPMQEIKFKIQKSYKSTMKELPLTILLLNNSDFL